MKATENLVRTERFVWLASLFIRLAVFTKGLAEKTSAAHYFIIPLSSPLNAVNNRVQNRLQICKHSCANLSCLNEY